MIDFEEDSPPAQPPAPDLAPEQPQPAKRAPAKKPHGKQYPYVPEESGTPGRVPPHSVEAEEQLLSACLLDGGDVIQKCLDAGVRSDTTFYVPANRMIYARLLVMFDAGKPIDIAILAEELKTSKLLDAIGGYAYLTRISGRIPTTAGASYFIEKVRELETLRELARICTGTVEDTYGYTGGLEEFLREQENRLTDFCARARGQSEFKTRGIFDYEYPSDDDPNALLGSDDWAGRGGGGLMVSHAGAGKSSVVMNACLFWTQGLPFMGIPSKGKHRILIVQAEDSERYLGKIVTSFRAANQLNDETCREINDRVRVVQVKGVSGLAFLSVLQGLVKKHQPDIVVINPVYLYIDGDVSDSKETKDFLNGLDAINAKNGNRFFWLLVHHTGKPPRDEQKETMDWETAYAGIGSSVWANWPRCSMLLEPRQNMQGRYFLRLGKAGRNAGVMRHWTVGTEQYSEAVTKIPMKHSAKMLEIGGRPRPMIYWEPDTEEDAGAAADAAPKPKGGRRSAWTDAELASYYPSSMEAGKKIGQITREAREGCGIPDSTFAQRRRDLLEKGWITDSGGFHSRTQLGDDYARLKHQPGIQ